MFRINEMFESGVGSNLPKGSLVGFESNGTIRLAVNCSGGAIIAMVVSLLCQLKDDDFEGFLEGWNNYMKNNNSSSRCLQLQTEAEEIRALRAENRALRTENSNLRFTLKNINKEEK